MGTSIASSVRRPRQQFAITSTSAPPVADGWRNFRPWPGSFGPRPFTPPQIACGRECWDALVVQLPGSIRVTGLEATVPAPQAPRQNVRTKVVSTDEWLNSFEEIASYNNFYEFGPGPGDPRGTRDA